MENIKCNFDNNILYFDNLENGLIDFFNLNFRNKNILIIGLNNPNLENLIRRNRNNFSILFCDDFDSEIMQKSDVIIFFVNKFNYQLLYGLNIKKNVVVVIEDSKIEADFFNLKKEDLIIIINNETVKKESDLYCNYLIRFVINKFIELEEEIDGIFFNDNKKSYNSLLSFKNYQEFEIEDYFELLFNRKNLDYKSDNKNISRQNFEFLIIQILINLYKNFIEYASINHVQKIESYFFSLKKFWFIKEKCRNILLKKIDKIENLFKKIIQIMCRINIDFYYNLSLNFDNFEYKNLLNSLGRSCKSNKLLKAVYQMGLLEF